MNEMSDLYWGMLTRTRPEFVREKVEFVRQNHPNLTKNLTDRQVFTCWDNSQTHDQEGYLGIYLDMANKELRLEHP